MNKKDYRILLRENYRTIFKVLSYEGFGYRVSTAFSWGMDLDVKYRNIEKKKRKNVE